MIGLGAEDLSVPPCSSPHDPILTGRRLDDGPRPGMVNVVFLYSAEGTANQRQARAIVSLYRQFHSRVHFVAIDLSRRAPPAQQGLVRDYYRGMAPHVAILDQHGEPLFDRAGEAAGHDLAKILNKELTR